VVEWFKAPVLKTGVGSRPPWVRIPPHPPCSPFVHIGLLRQRVLVRSVDACLYTSTDVHHAALPYAEVASFIGKLRQRAGPLASRLAFEFLVLTATRSGETRGAAWSEIDLTQRLWIVPAQRMKARAAHIVPLSDRAAAILETARAAFADGPLCFPNAKGVRFSDMVFTKALRDMGLAQRATAHGFRTSFKTWAAETGVRDEVSEAALAHTDPNPVRAAYRRTTFLDERRVVMQAWADFVKGAPRATT
jgi:integrase